MYRESEEVVRGRGETSEKQTIAIVDIEQYIAAFPCDFRVLI